MEYEIDGTRFSTLEELFAEFSRVVLLGFDPLLSNLDAFDDALSGGAARQMEASPFDGNTT
jgi:hypothetical protein